jgi:hypothetical protein
MIPTQGRIVEYTLTDDDCARISQARSTDRNSARGNSVSAGDTYPLVITRVWGQTEGSAVNGQVLLDGDDTLWVTSVTQGPDARQWRPFARVEG